MSRREYENIKILKGYFVSINLINPQITYWNRYARHLDCVRYHYLLGLNKIQSDKERNHHILFLANCLI